MAACVTHPRLPSPEFYFLAVSYNFVKYFFNVTKSLQLHSHYKFCQGWLWIVLCSLEHKIRIFIAATVNSISSKESRFLPSIKSWISYNWELPFFWTDLIFFLKLPSVLSDFFFFFLVLDIFVYLNNQFSSKSWHCVHEQAGAVSVSKAVNILFLLECYSLVLVTSDPVRAVKAINR